MQNYTELDKDILAKIKAGTNTFTTLTHALKIEAEPFVAKQRGPFPTPYWRVIDRRLQALRKRGLLTYSRKAGEWRVTPSPNTTL